MIRQAIEKAIVTKLIEELHERGFDLVINDSCYCDGEDFEIKSGVPYNVEEVLDHTFAGDDAFVVVNSRSNRIRGWIRLIYGNDGYDVINDYTTNLEDYLSGTLQLATRIEEGDFKVVA